MTKEKEKTIKTVIKLDPWKKSIFKTLILYNPNVDKQPKANDSNNKNI